jgi:hypothetical protein
LQTKDSLKHQTKFKYMETKRLDIKKTSTNQSNHYNNDNHYVFIWCSLFYGILLQARLSLTNKKKE